MIQKLRWKFVAIMMAIITIMLIIIFAGLLVSSRAQFVQLSLSRLHNVIREDSPGKNMPSPGAMPPPEREATPTLVVSVGKSGTLKILKNQFSDMEQEQMEELVAYVDSRKDDTGFIREYDIRYLREATKEGRTRYAFADCTIEQSSLRSQMYNSILIGLAAFFLLLLVIIHLSNWVVRPAAKAWEQQRRFVADASHELKTPLTVILSNTNMLLDNPDIADGKTGERLFHIQAEAVRMKRLTENLLQLARIDSNTERTVHQPFNLSLLLRRCILTLEPVFYEAGKKLEEDIEEDIMIRGSETGLRQVMDILLDNAFKYSSKNASTIIKLRRTSARELLLTVSNEGTPIPPAEYRKLFDRFYRADRSRSGIAGYGLGLSIARIVIEEHGGKIQASSDGHNTNTFSVRLPCME